MTFLPGKKGRGLSRDYDRDLVRDVRWLRRALGVDAFLLFVEDHELSMFQVPNIAEVMAEQGIELIRFPIEDTRVPMDRPALELTLGDLRTRLARGETVAVACRGGLGRTGTVVGCLLRDAGLGRRRSDRAHPGKPPRHHRELRAGTVREIVGNDIDRSRIDPGGHHDARSGGAAAPSGRTVSITRFLRGQVRADSPIERTASCWAPNKPAIIVDGEKTWPEYALSAPAQLEPGWDGRWIKNWTGGREFCLDVDRPHLSLPLRPRNS